MAYKVLFYRYCAISYLKLCLSGFLLLVFVGTAGAEIASTPLMAYSSGGRNILVIFGNSSTMGDDLDGTISKSGAVARAIEKMIKPLTATQLLTDTNMATVTAVLNGRRVGLGLMTYGGTSATSPYVGSATTPYSWPPDPPAFPYSNYKSELTASPVAGTSWPDCNDDVNGASSGSFATLFYRNPASNSHPYCLPKPNSVVCVGDSDVDNASCPTDFVGTVTVGVPRPTGYLEQGGATCTPTPPISGLYTLCYGSPATASTPAMGKLRIPVQAIPPSPGALQSNSATLATTFSTAVSSAGNAGGRAIEGALLTACDYFNTSWLDAAYNPPRNMSLCYRGYRPGPNDIPPPNKLTDIGQIDTTRISRIADIPNMPGACQSAVIMITDGSQTTTADGQFYTPGLKTHESSKLAGIPITDPPPNPTSYSGADVDPLSGLTDPVLLALDNLKAMNKQGADKITTFFVGLGADWDPDIDVLGQKGLNDRYGSMTYPWDQAALKEALDNAVSNALYTPGTNAGLATATTVAASSSVLSNNILIFQAEFRFDHGWKGDLEASTIAAANPTAAGTVVWNAASNPLDPANRSIFSYIPGTGGTTFNWAGLSSSQQAVLTSHDADNPSLLVDWLRGDVSYDNNDKYRNRGGEGNLLGDIVNSDPVYVGIDNYAYDILPGAEGTSYASFLASKTSRQPVVYVGANDGMLHGFSIGTSNYRTGAYKDGGGEVLAYVPNAVIGLSELNSPLVKYATPPPGAAYYPHIYTVDGSPSVGDAYISSAWKTVLVGTTGAGGKSIFALDITNPLSFANANVLWEISDTDDATIGACTPVCRNITTGTSTSIHGDLGYTFAQPTIVRLNNGHWGAVVGNGYNSARGHAVLFIFDLADGSLIKKIDTGAAGNTVIAKNGLSTPIAIDVNGDRIADTVYAGDLTGNLWKFDISSTNTSNWGSAYNTGRRTPVPAPLFVACTRQCQDDEDLQPITGKPNIGPASGTDQGSGLMVYFGTGKYFELADNIVDLAVTTPSKQSFYALWDNGSKITGRRSSVLQDQTIETESASYRTTSSNTVDYTQEQGWYMDLLSPSNPTHQGERIVSLPIVRNGRIIFVTMTPNSVASCKAGGFSWVMEMEAVSGKPLASSSPWDTNGDGTIDSSDLIDGSVPSGMKSSIGIVKTPTILAPNTNCTTEIKVFGGTGGTAGIKEKNVESCSPGTAASGRSSWRHL